MGAVRSGKVVIVWLMYKILLLHFFQQCLQVFNCLNTCNKTGSMQFSADSIWLLEWHYACWIWDSWHTNLERRSDQALTTRNINNMRRFLEQRIQRNGLLNLGRLYMPFFPVLATTDQFFQLAEKRGRGNRIGLFVNKDCTVGHQVRNIFCVFFPAKGFGKWAATLMILRKPKKRSW